MPDEDDDDKPCPCSWMDKAKAICLVIAAVGGLVASTTAAIFSGLNNRQGSAIESRQVENSAKIDAAASTAVAVKEKLVESKSITDAKLDRIADKVDATPAATAAAVKGKG